jgi:hypothetical protein
MNEKMPEKTRAIILNLAMLAGLIWYYFRGYPLAIILISVLFLLC